MKQLLAKLLKPLQRGGKGGSKTSLPRITNETLAEDREAVLTKGKRYKYPVQQTKKRTVIVSGILVVLLLAITSAFIWSQLYVWQSTSAFMHRVTQILPLPVGKVDGETVLYRDYLTHLRSSLYYLSEKESVNLQSDSGQRQVAYQQRQAMNRVLEQALVRKIARQEGISVSNQEVKQFIDNQIESNEIGATRENFQDVIEEYYDWTFFQYEQSVKEGLLKQKVTSALAKEAEQTAEQVLAQLAKENGPEFSELAKQYSDDAATKQNGGDVGFVPSDAPGQDDLAETASELKKNQVSEIIESTDGLYIIKTLGKRDDQVRYAQIFIRFDAFEERFNNLRQEGKVQEYIDVPESPEATPQR